MATTAQNWAEFGLLRIAIGVKRRIGAALDTAGIQRKGRLYFLYAYGDPGYYGRFGFEAGLGERFTAPYPLQYPFGWQAMALAEDVTLPAGPVRIHCVGALDDPAMW